MFIDEDDYAYYDWFDFESDILDIEEEFLAEAPHVVAVYRGSLPAAVKLSNAYENGMSIIRFQTRDGDDKTPEWIINEIPKEGKILIVDDIYDTGHTLEKIKEFLEPEYGNRLLFACLTINETVGKPESMAGLVHTYRQTHGSWVRFPWE